jgi:hypothetical protein
MKKLDIHDLEHIKYHFGASELVLPRGTCGECPTRGSYSACNFTTKTKHRREGDRGINKETEI